MEGLVNVLVEGLVNVLGAVTALVCAVLLHRGYRRTCTSVKSVFGPSGRE